MSCACGCGHEPNPGKRYVSGHNHHPATQEERNAEIRLLVLSGEKKPSELAKKWGISRQRVCQIAHRKRKRDAA